MATRKKKTDSIVLDMPGTIGGAKLIFSDPSGVVKGSHLTVTTLSDGSTKLDWDDEALLREVRAAILSAELADMKPAVRAKVATRKKKEKINE